MSSGRLTYVDPVCVVSAADSAPSVEAGVLDLASNCHGNQVFFWNTATKNPPVSWKCGKTLKLQ